MSEKSGLIGVVEGVVKEEEKPKMRPSIFNRGPRE
jgi:hypothetical protein